MKNLFRNIIPVGVVLVGFSFSMMALASDEEATTSSGEREPAALHIADKAQLRQYPGGPDEQDIKVQSSLPQPPKNIEGSAVGEMIVPDDHD